MSDTTDFVRRLRSGDHVILMVEGREGIERIAGVVEKHWSNGTITVGDFKLRDFDYVIAGNVLAIRYKGKSHE